MQALTEALPTGGGHRGCRSESSPSLICMINALSVCPSPVSCRLPELKSLPSTAVARAQQRPDCGFRRCRGKRSPPSLSAMFSPRLTPCRRPPGQPAAIEPSVERGHHNHGSTSHTWHGAEGRAPCPPEPGRAAAPSPAFCSGFRWAHSPPALSTYSKLHALNISQKFKVTEPEVLQSGTLNFRKLVRILECACSLFNCSTSFSSMLLCTAVQDTY